MRPVPWRVEKWERLASLRGFALAICVVRAGPGMVRRREWRILRMNPKRAGAGEHRMMAHAAQNLVGFGLVVVDAFAIAPAMRGEVQRHHVILFAIGRCAGGSRRPVGGHGPG